MEINISEEEQRKCFLSKYNKPDVITECEVPVFCRSVDLVTFNTKQNELTSIEFKTKDWRRAIEQVMSTSVSFDNLEICIRKPQRKETQMRIVKECAEKGIGVYFFDTVTREFEHSLMPKCTHRVWNVQRNQVIDYILYQKTNGTFSHKLDRAVTKAKEQEEWEMEYMIMNMMIKQEREESAIFERIATALDLGASKEKILDMLVHRFQLSKEDAEEKIQEYESENN